MTEKPDKQERKPRLMRLPRNPRYPNYDETHLENDWCAKAGCVPVCESEETRQ